MRPYPSVDTTLTGSELSNPFRIADIDPEPLPEQTRLAVEWYGQMFVEWDIRTGRSIDFGMVGP